LLLPRSWIWGVSVVIILLLGNPSTTHGGSAFIRFQHGKAIFLTLLLPLLVTHAIEFSLKPDISRWLRLMATQVASVGLTSTALWAAPLIAGLALICGFSIRRRPLWTLSSGMLASVYTIGAALYLRFQLQDVAIMPRPVENIILMQEALNRMLRTAPRVNFGLFIIIGAWALARSPLQRRFAAVFPLGFLCLWSPFWASFLAERITHPWTFWRVTWILPLPALVALMLTWPIDFRRLRRVPVWFRTMQAMIFLATLVYLAGNISQGKDFFTRLSAKGRVRFGLPTWKVPQEEFAVACAAAESTTPGAAVLAPSAVSPWITTLHSHPLPLVVRPILLSSQKDVLGSGEYRRRMALFRLVSGGPESPRARQFLQTAHEDYSLSAIALARAANIEWQSYRELLQSAGFRRALQTVRFEVWTRQHASESAGARKRSRSCGGFFSPVRDYHSSP
jgi:hypothetical protein